MACSSALVNPSSRPHCVQLGDRFSTVDVVESLAEAVFQLVEHRPVKLAAGYSEVRARFDSEGATMVNTSVDCDFLALYGRIFNDSLTSLLSEGVVQRCLVNRVLVTALDV